MSSIEAPRKAALKVDADLVEWALKALVSTPDFKRIDDFTHPDIVEESTALRG